MYKDLKQKKKYKVLLIARNYKKFFFRYLKKSRKPNFYGVLLNYKKKKKHDLIKCMWGIYAPALFLVLGIFGCL